MKILFNQRVWVILSLIGSINCVYNLISLERKYFERVLIELYNLITL